MPSLHHAIEHFGVAIAANSGVLAARGKRIDLFGVIVLALVTALGGGSLRDLVLHGVNVFWIEDSSYVFTAVVVAVVMFFIARHVRTALVSLVVADAFALAFFTILGAAKGLDCATGGFNAIVLGVITGVAGGIVRDVLLGEIPLVFRQEIYLYATAAFAGATIFVVVEQNLPGAVTNRWLGIGVVLVVRIAAIRHKWSLPVLLSETRKDSEPTGR